MSIPSKTPKSCPEGQTPALPLQPVHPQVGVIAVQQIVLLAQADLATGVEGAECLAVVGPRDGAAAVDGQFKRRAETREPQVMPLVGSALGYQVLAGRDQVEAASLFQSVEFRIIIPRAGHFGNRGYAISRVSMHPKALTHCYRV